VCGGDSASSYAVGNSVEAGEGLDTEAMVETLATSAVAGC